MEAKIVAVSGKGGVGKTVFSAALARNLINSEIKLLLIDADPAQGLIHIMGLEPGLKTIGQVRDEIIAKAESEDKNPKQEVAAHFDYLVREALVEGEGFSILSMGAHHHQGCYCPLNNLLRQAIETLSEEFDLVIIDAEAGIEQINRRVIRGIDALVIMIDSSIRSVTVAVKIKETLKALKVKCRFGVVANRVYEERKSLQKKLFTQGMDLWGAVPEDPLLKKNDSLGKSIFELSEKSALMKAARETIQKGLKGSRIPGV